MGMVRKKRIRILILIRKPVGGIRTFVRYVFRRFDPKRFQLTILAPDVEELKELCRDLKGMDVKTITFRDEISGTRLAFMVLKVMLSGKFDLIHSNGFTSGVCAALPARICGVRHVMTSHDVLLDNQFRGNKGRLKKRALSAFLPMVDILHSVSHDAQNNLLEHIPVLNRFKKKLAVVPHGIDIGLFSKGDKRDLHKELGLGDDMFIVGFLGRFMNQKGFLVLVDAFEKLLKKGPLPKKPIVVAFGYNGFIREDTEYMKNKGLGEYFFFLPFEPNIASTLRGLDVVAMPSLWEASGLLAMESMVAGVPLIGTDCIGLRETLANTPCRMVPAGDSSALASAIEDEIRHPSVEAAMVFASEAAERFDARTSAAALEALVLGLLGEEIAVTMDER